MTHATNGRTPPAAAAAGVQERAHRRGLRRRTLLVPVALAFGVILILRYFEQQTAGG
ncbi:MAG: hypothetical protein HYX50_00295 [Chloroflexi bacterium]|nr:hypothetical protein [Chloroflexota bacterium]